VRHVYPLTVATTGNRFAPSPTSATLGVIQDDGRSWPLLLQLDTEPDLAHQT